MDKPCLRIDRVYIEHLHLHPRPRPALPLVVGMPVQRHKEPTMSMEFRITSEYKLPVGAKHPMTPLGRPATLDGPVTFTVLEGTCTIEPIDDVTAYLVPGDDFLDSVVLMEADADLGDGVETISETVILHVDHPMASSMGVEAGEPVLR